MVRDRKINELPWRSQEKRLSDDECNGKNNKWKERAKKENVPIVGR